MDWGKVSNKYKIFDLIILVFIPLISGFVVIYFRLNFLLSTISFFCPPIALLLLKNKFNLKKIFIFSLLFSFPVAFIFDYLVSLDYGWIMTETSFSYRLLDVIVLEQFLWGFFCTLYLILFYEHFFDKREKYFLFRYFFKNRNKEFEYFSILMFSIVLLVIFLSFTRPDILKIDYSYILLGVIFGVIPLSLFLVKFPNFFYRFTGITLYFLFLAVIIEYAGLEVGHWVFPGQHYIGKINFFGNLIPLEEILIYFIVSPPAVLSYYEYLYDDRK